MRKRHRKRKRKCKHCGKMYLPDLRTRDRQKHCSAPECQRASKAWRQRRWYYSEKGAEYRDPAYNKQRVQEWRKAHPSDERIEDQQGGLQIGHGLAQALAVLRRIQQQARGRVRPPPRRCLRVGGARR